MGVAWAFRTGTSALALYLAFALRGAAQAESTACGEGTGEAVVVRSVDADWSMALEDGRVIRLAGTEPPGGAGLEAGRIQDGRERLSAWLTGVPARMQTTGQLPDRWGRLQALLFAPPPSQRTAERAGASSDEILVNAAMLDAGLARAMPEPGGRPCWTRLLAAEASARKAGLGVWSDRRYGVAEANDLVALSDRTGLNVVVQGRVGNVGKTRARLYLDLGPRGQAVVLRIDRRRAFILDQLELRQDGLVGVMLRVRGVLDRRGDLGIDLLDADQVEVLEKGDVGAAGRRP